MGYWVSIHGRRFGPHSGGQIRTMLHSGQIPGGAEVWIPSENRWISAPDLSPVAADAHQSMTAPRNGTSTGKSALVAPLTSDLPTASAAAPVPGRPLNARFNPLAVTCFVLALVSLPLLAIVIGFPIAVLAVVLGHKALHGIERSRTKPVPQKGNTLAVIGLILGYLSICVGAVVMVPALLALPLLD